MPTEFMTFKEHVENDAKLALHMFEQCCGDSGRLNKLVDLMSKDHRTHQQNFTRLMLEYLKNIADNEYDLRNEASVKVARELKATVSVIHNQSILDTYLPKV